MTEKSMTEKSMTEKSMTEKSMTEKSMLVKLSTSCLRPLSRMLKLRDIAEKRKKITCVFIVLSFLNIVEIRNKNTIDKIHIFRVADETGTIIANIYGAGHLVRPGDIIKLSDGTVEFAKGEFYLSSYCGHTEKIGEFFMGYSEKKNLGKKDPVRKMAAHPEKQQEAGKE
ncbi:MAG: oligonucleotide/oligosaccharide-binding fold containing 2B [Amphiamblys sp. WSBS2006]|nr:MAG: oligonucleotide/oligosaccharide-binding fold containing 2B [Amphiamblys sp. WSBS2006]